MGCNNHDIYHTLPARPPALSLSFSVLSAIDYVIDEFFTCSFLFDFLRSPLDVAKARPNTCCTTVLLCGTAAMTTNQPSFFRVRTCFGHPMGPHICAVFGRAIASAIYLTIRPIHDQMSFYRKKQSSVDSGSAPGDQILRTSRFALTTDFIYPHKLALVLSYRIPVKGMSLASDSARLPR